MIGKGVPQSGEQTLCRPLGAPSVGGLRILVVGGDTERPDRRQPLLRADAYPTMVLIRKERDQLSPRKSLHRVRRLGPHFVGIPPNGATPAIEILGRLALERSHARRGKARCWWGAFPAWCCKGEQHLADTKRARRHGQVVGEAHRRGPRLRGASGQGLESISDGMDGLAGYRPGGPCASIPLHDSAVGAKNGEILLANTGIILRACRSKSPTACRWTISTARLRRRCAEHQRRPLRGQCRHQRRCPQASRTHLLASAARTLMRPSPGSKSCSRSYG